MDLSEFLESGANAAVQVLGGLTAFEAAKNAPAGETSGGKPDPDRGSPDDNASGLSIGLPTVALVAGGVVVAVLLLRS